MSTSTRQYKNLNILYVEDEKIIRTNVESCLKYIFNIIVAKDGQEGLKYFKEKRFDLVITDINMPIKDGLSMLKEIKDINPNIPCIITSAYDLEIVKKLESIAICEYISKPFDVKDLLTNSLRVLKL